MQATSATISTVCNMYEGRSKLVAISTGQAAIIPKTQQLAQRGPYAAKTGLC